MILVKVPAINGLGHTRGCEKAPNILCKEYKECKEIKVDNENVEETQNIIYKKAQEFIKKDFVLFLGGDHSISFPIAKAFSEKSKRKKYLVVFDAHADCMKPMKEPTHEEWLRAVIERKLFNKIFLIGLRKTELEEKKFLQERKEVKILRDKEIDLPLDCDIYISIDIDAFNPDIAPGTSYKEKGGITFEDFSNMIKKIKNRIKAADLVEINPEKDINNKTFTLGMRIIEEFM